jgi:hypothetical protein
VRFSVRTILSLAFVFFAATAVSAMAEEIEEAPITSAAREHWSFQLLKRPPLPDVKNAALARNQIDLFLLARLQEREIEQQPEADRETLIRRVTLDLTGLPPSPSEIDAFLADQSLDAYEQLIDRLLASPMSGERFAQPWLDLARWAETDGFEHDVERPDAWKYRDWVIDALNADLPYDQFLSQQLAGDEIHPGDPVAQTATGFCLAGPDMPDINLKDERRHTVLNDIASTVGSVFMGLQFGCAQCHDHKYDPISQADFYRLRAIFEPAVDFSGHVLREGKQKDIASHFYVRGDFRRQGPEVNASLPRVVNWWNDEVQPPSPDEKSSTRRKQLATWLTRDDHPLTGRVMANRLWQQHFGRGLTETPSDFGTIGDPPLHKELLDWLATELVEQDWSVKSLRRLIVTSATYRQASRPSGDNTAWRAALEKDPRNLFFSRYPRHRVSGEMLRDMMLATSDSLNTDQHGKGVRPPLPKEVVQTLLSPDHWKVSAAPADHYRRSVYVFARRNLRYPMFEAFDRPAATASCPQRPSSTIAPQSLILFNSDFSSETARRLAESVLREVPGDRERQIEVLYRRTVGRRPTKEELSDITAFFQLRSSEQDAAEAFVDLCLTMLNSSEFSYIE